MTLCASCGAETYAEHLCPFHVSGDSGWAQANKIMCDFFHRGMVPSRLREDERFDGNIPDTSPDVPTFVYTGDSM